MLWRGGSFMICRTGYVAFDGERFGPIRKEARLKLPCRYAGVTLQLFDSYADWRKEGRGCGNFRFGRFLPTILKVEIVANFVKI